MIKLDAIKKFAQLHADTAALVYHDQTLSWQQFAQATETKVGYLLSRYGDKLPRQVCFISANRLDLLPWMAAFATLAIPSVGIDYSLPFPTIESMVERIEADFVLLSSRLFSSSPAFLNMLSNLSSHSMVLDLDSRSMVTADSIGSVKRANGYTLPPARPFRAISFTSGTTSSPKPVLRTQSFDQRRFRYFTDLHHFNADDRFMVAMPLYHAAGNGWARLFLSLGATLYLMDSDDTHGMAKVLDQHAITASVFNPALLAAVIRHRNATQCQPPAALRWVLVGGRNFNAIEKQRALSSLGPVIYEYYGTTESGVNTIASPDDLAHHSNTVGKAFDGNTIAIIAPDGTRLPAGEVGQVCIASYMNMDDYLDGNSHFVWLDDGQRYFVAPDQGYLDTDGRLTLLNRSGEHAQPLPLYRLENTLRQFPCLDDVALLAEREAHRTIVRCAYTRSAESTPGSALQDRIIDAARREKIVLQQCRQVDDIPYSPSGKVRVSILKDILATA